MPYLSEDDRDVLILRFVLLRLGDGPGCGSFAAVHTLLNERPGYANMSDEALLDAAREAKVSLAGLEIHPTA